MTASGPPGAAVAQPTSGRVRPRQVFCPIEASYRDLGLAADVLVGRFRYAGVTLDLGLRWEYYPIMHRADRGLERVDLATLNVLLGGRGGNPKNVGLEASKDNFAPRLGLIYRIDDNTVARAGYGVTYNSGPWGRPLRGFYPATIASSFFQNEPFGWFGANGAALALLCAWAMRDVLTARRGEEIEGDLLGTAVISTVVFLMPAFDPFASWVAGGVGVVVGALAGLLLARVPE